MIKTKKAKLKKSLHKKFVLAVINIIIFQLIRKKPVSSYDIIDQIKEQFNVKISPGTIYPVLSKLKKHGLIGVKKYGRKTLFCPTKNGDIVRRMLLSHYLNIQKNIGHMFREKKKLIKKY